jgi:hypothetical protein
MINIITSFNNHLSLITSFMQKIFELCNLGQTKLINEILSNDDEEESSLDLDERDEEGNLLVVIAAKRNDFDTLKLLGEHGADLSLKDAFETDCLEWAKYHNNQEMIKYISKKVLIRTLEEEQKRIIEKEKNFKIKCDNVLEECDNEMKEVDLKYASRSKELNLKLSQIQKEIEDLNKKIDEEKQYVCEEIRSKRGIDTNQDFDTSYYDQILLLLSGKKIYFDKESEYLDFYRRCENLDDREDLLDTLKSYCIEKSLGNEIIDLVHNSLIISEEELKIYLKGRIKGYKGDETTFKYNEHYPPEIEKYVDAIPSEDKDWEEYFRELDYYNVNKKDIQWPESDSTMAYATFFVDVYLCFIK